MFVTELELGGAARDPRPVRWQLFVFHDVLPGPSPGTVLVIRSGVARRRAWRAALQDAAGLPSDPSRRAVD